MNQPLTFLEDMLDLKIGNSNKHVQVIAYLNLIILWFPYLLGPCQGLPGKQKIGNEANTENL